MKNFSIGTGILSPTYYYVPHVKWGSESHPRIDSTQRLEELSAISKAARFGQVYHLQKPDYLRDVTETSEGAYVLVHLTSAMSNDGESRRLTEIWREIAPLFGEIKFCEIQGDMCIEGYPDRNCPTILVYHDGQIVRQLLTLKELNGIRSTSAGQSSS